VLELLAEILPLMLAAASNPAVVGIVVLMLTAADRPLARAGAFVIGFGVVLVAAGIAGLIVFSSARETLGPGGSLFAWVDIVVGVGLLGFAVVTYVRRDQPASQDRLLERVGPSAFFAVGAIFMITNASALAAYAPLLREIAVAGVSRFERGIALAISDLVIIAPIAAPLLICLVAPRSSQRILAALRAGLDRYGWMIAIAVFGAIGTFLLVRGLTRL
jgi:Sap-like sulfolipid-1-addressing protein